MNVKQPSIFFLLAVASATASADMAASLNYLKSEPANLFDLGMNRLNDFMRSDEDVSAFALYEESTNRIAIMLFDRKQPANAAEAQRRCDQLISNARLELLNLVEDGSESVMDVFFSHEGIESPQQPQSLGSDLDAATVFVATVKVDETQVTCESKLRGQEPVTSEKSD